MLQDLNQRHVLEYKKTLEFLKFALGNRAPTKGGSSMMGSQAHSKSLISASMMSANQMHNQSRLSEGPSGIKAR